MASQLRETKHIIAAVTAGNHFNARTPSVAELTKQFLETGGRNLIPRWVRQHRLPASGANPANGFIERRPLPGHMAWFTLH